MAVEHAAHGRLVSAVCTRSIFFNLNVSSDDIKKPIMNLHISIVPIVSLISGILILVMPKLLNYIIALYLIAIGLIGLFGTGHMHIN